MTGWRVERVAGEHEGEPNGRTWEAWDVYLNDRIAFRSPSLDLAESGMRDWDRSGHGAAGNSDSTAGK